MNLKFLYALSSLLTFVVPDAYDQYQYLSHDEPSPHLYMTNYEIKEANRSIAFAWVADTIPSATTFNTSSLLWKLDWEISWKQLFIFHRRRNHPCYWSIGLSLVRIDKPTSGNACFELYILLYSCFAFIFSKVCGDEISHGFDVDMM